MSNIPLKKHFYGYSNPCWEAYFDGVHGRTELDAPSIFDVLHRDDRARMANCVLVDHAPNDYKTPRIQALIESSLVGQANRVYILKKQTCSSN